MKVTDTFKFAFNNDSRRRTVKFIDDIAHLVSIWLPLAKR